MPYTPAPVTNTKGVPGVVYAPCPSSLAISGCGNFIVVGYTDGSMHRFNLQSGMHRGAFARMSAVKQAHSGTVARVEVVKSSRVLSASSCPNDCVLRQWDIESHKLIGEMNLGSGGFNVIQTFQSCGAFIAVILATQSVDVKGTVHTAVEDPSQQTSFAYSGSSKVVITDFQTKQVVREFPIIESDIIVAMTFSRDLRWLAFSTFKQPHIYVFDILSSCLIDWIELQSSAVSIAFDYSNAFVYLGLLKLKGGVFVLGNKHIFDPASSAPLLASTPTEPIKIGGHAVQESNQQIGEAMEQDSRLLSTFNEAQLEPGMLTLSGESEGRLQAIIHLERIRGRNAPQKPPQEPSEAPFFLPTVYEGKDLKFAIPEKDVDSGNSDYIKLAASGASAGKSLLQQQLALLKRATTKCKKEENDDSKEKVVGNILAYLKSLSPSGVHLAVTELGMLAGSEDEELELMVEFFVDCVRSRKDADFVQAVLHVFLEAHGETLATLLTDDTGNNSKVHIADDEDSKGCFESGKKGKKRKRRIATGEAEDDNFGTHSRETFCKLLRENLNSLRNCLRNDWIPIDLQCHQLTCFTKYLVHAQIE